MFLQLFRDPEVHDLLLSLLHTAQHVAIFKNSKLSNAPKTSASLCTNKQELEPNEPVPIVAAKLLWTLHQDDLHWPLPLFEAYLNDALDCRVWVDSEDPLVKRFCSNLLMWMGANDVKFSSDEKGVIQMDFLSLSETEGSDEEGGEEVVLLDEGGDVPPPFPPSSSTSSSTISSASSGAATSSSTLGVDRFDLPGLHQQAISLTLAVTQARVAKAKNTAGGGGLGPFLKTLRVLCRLPCVRLLATQNLTLWLGNPALVSE